MTDPTHNQPGTFDPLPRHLPAAAAEHDARVASSRQGHPIGDVVFDESHHFPLPVAAEHTLTYRGRVDLPPGAQLGPGLDGRTATVIGCIYDQGSGETHVFAEAVTPPSSASQIDEWTAAFSRAVADRHELAMSGAR
jgi:hypothetical protein